MQNIPTSPSLSPAGTARRLTGVADATQQSSATNTLQLQRSAADAQDGGSLQPLGEPADRLLQLRVDPLSRMLTFLDEADVMRLASASGSALTTVARASGPGTESGSRPELRDVMAAQQKALENMRLPVSTSQPRGSGMEQIGGLVTRLMRVRQNRIRRETARSVCERQQRGACLQVADQLTLTDATALRRAAQVLAQHAQPVAAFRVLQRAIALHPQDAYLRLLAAAVCVQAGPEQGLLNEAIAHAEAARDMAPAFFDDACDHIARANLLLGKLDAASLALEGAPKLTTGAMIAFKRGNEVEARELLDEATQSRVSATEWGEAAGWCGLHREAIRSFAHASERGALDYANSLHSPFLTREVLAQEAMQELLDSLFRLPDQLLKVQFPQAPVPLDGRALTAAERLSELSERAQRVQEALRFDDPLAVRHAAELLVQLGRADEAHAWLMDLEASMSAEMDWNFAMAEVLIHSGAQRAQEASDRALESASMALQASTMLQVRMDGLRLRPAPHLPDLYETAWLQLWAKHVGVVSMEFFRVAILRSGNVEFAAEKVREWVDLVSGAAPARKHDLATTACFIAWVQFLQGCKAEAVAVLDEAILKGAGEINPCRLAQGFAVLGDEPRFFEWIEQALKTDYQGVLRLMIPGSPYIPPSIAQSARWQDFLRTMGRSQEQLDEVQFHVRPPVLPGDTFNAHLAVGRWQDAAAMVRAGKFGETRDDRARVLLIACLEPAQLDAALRTQLAGQGNAFSERVEVALSIIDEGLLGDHTRRGYITLLSRLEQSATGKAMLPSLTQPERLARLARLAQYGLTQQDIASLAIGSQLSSGN